MGKRSLVALDTQHIKAYVFETGRLKEIRGASSILDRLNRQEMGRIASQADQDAVEIFANGGSGLYAIDSDCVEGFCRSIQTAYETQTKGSSSIACAVLELTEGIPTDKLSLMNAPLKNEFELLRFLLQKEKSRPSETIALPSHPLMHTCNACGIRYAQDKDTSSREDPDEPDEGDILYCASCLEKRREDSETAMGDLQRIWRWPPEPGVSYYYPSKQKWFDTPASRGKRIRDTRNVPG